MKKKILLEILKIACEEVYVQQKIFKDSTFSQLLLKDFAETFQNAYWEKYIFQWHLPEIDGYFP